MSDETNNYRDSEDEKIDGIEVKYEKPAETTIAENPIEDDIHVTINGKDVESYQNEIELKPYKKHKINKKNRDDIKTSKPVEKLENEYNLTIKYIDSRHGKEVIFTKKYKTKPVITWKKYKQDICELWINGKGVTGIGYKNIADPKVQKEFEEKYITIS